MSREATTGMRQLVGTRISAAVEVSETVLQDALERLPELPDGTTLKIARANQIVVRYGVVFATVVLAPDMDLRGPRIELEMRSALLAWALQQRIKTPGVSISGRRVTIDLSRIEALAAFSGAWQHFRAVRFATVDGALFVHVDFAVE